jgi:hypothetical protein
LRPSYDNNAYPIKVVIQVVIRTYPKLKNACKFGTRVLSHNDLFEIIAVTETFSVCIQVPTDGFDWLCSNNLSEDL